MDTVSVLPEKTAFVVCERGRDLCDTFCDVDIRSGDEGEEAFGEATCDEVVDDAVDIVWYVRTGNRSTTDFGARHLRRLMRERSSNSAYTTVSVTSGLTTRTSRVSKKGLVETLVGVRVTHKPGCSSSSC